MDFSSEEDEGLIGQQVTVKTKELKVVESLTKKESEYLFKYKEGVDRECLKELNRQALKQLESDFETPYLQLSNQDCKRLNLNKWLSLVDQIYSSSLSFVRCLQPTIIQQLSHISFRNLENLILHGNHIQTLQPLSNIYMPLLNHLSLVDNLLVTLTSIRKINLPHLHSISIGQNYIHQLEPCTQMYAPLLLQFGVDSNVFKLYYHYPKLRRMDESMQWAYKLQSNSINYFQTQNILRMNNEYDHSLRKKYKKVIFPRLMS